MLEFLQRVFRLEKPGASKIVAKERLRLVLFHDRADISPQIMQSLKEDLIKVISEYMDIDQSGLEVCFSKESEGVALVCNIPILSLKRSVS